MIIATDIGMVFFSGVLLYGIMLFNRRFTELIMVLNIISKKKVYTNASGPPNIDAHQEQVKSTKFIMEREPEEFSSAISRAATVKGFGNMQQNNDKAN
jgi:hypothetical protein